MYMDDSIILLTSRFHSYLHASYLFNALLLFLLPAPIAEFNFKAILKAVCHACHVYS
uniref:Uncharacterized protein n=1 Tax=Rhizophora mucronata TaxID=61149 RepID=A0A2P2MZS9_RHIMU